MVLEKCFTRDAQAQMIGRGSEKLFLSATITPANIAEKGVFI
jgi:hypothetical protein